MFGLKSLSIISYMPTKIAKVIRDVVFNGIKLYIQN
jgi:hypothetical protein